MIFVHFTTMRIALLVRTYYSILVRNNVFKVLCLLPNLMHLPWSHKIWCYFEDWICMGLSENWISLPYLQVSGIWQFNLLHSEFIWGNIKKYICIFYHFLTSTLHRLLKSSLMEDKDLYNLHNQYHGCRWPGDLKSHGTNSHGIYPGSFGKFQA